MKIFTSILVFIVLFSLAFAETSYLQKREMNSALQLKNINLSRDLENVIFEEGFEEGLGEWETIDGSAPTNWTEEWHLSTTGAYEGQSWWMGDEDIGGYHNQRYLILDTPEVTLPAGDPTLTFNLNYCIEDPAGTDPPWDGWDGCNVRISTDGGSTWDVIDPVTPAYNCQHLWAFGHPSQGYNEGQNIAGWAGSSVTWLDAEFDLSAYAGDAIKIRFAFASDMAYDTTEDPDIFGMKVDNIDIAGIFQSDGEGAAGDSEMIPGYGGEVAGDFWVIDTTNPHDGTNAMRCTVQDDLIDELISPEVILPDLEEIEIYVDYWVFCDMLDSDGDGDNSLEDYYLVFVKSVDEIVWTRLHYNFNGPGSGGVASVWTLINQEYANDTFGWQSGTCDISDWAGETVQIKFQVLTDNNNDGGTGTGLFIDDFRVYNTVFQGPAPENLIATALPDNTVQLTWDPAQIGGGEGWIGWDSGVLEGYLGLTDPSEWDVASRFTASDMMPYVNGELTTVKFMPGSSLTSSYSVRVWTGSMAAALVAEVAIEDPVPEDWNEVILPEPVLIELGEELWIGYHIDQVDPADPGGYSAGYDAGPSVAGLYYNPGTGWSNLSGDFDYNWIIQGYIEAADGRVFEFAPYQNQTRELENYNVWHSSTSEGPYDLLDSVEIMDEPTYIHTTPAGGAFNYYVVTTVYDGFDSGYSNEASAFVLDNESTLLYYDDGEAESGYNVGQGRHMAVKFTPDYDRLREPVTVTHIVLYVHEVNVGNTIFRIYDDDGDGGLPGPAFISQFAITGSLVDGWNTIPIPESEQQEFSEGSFYLAILEITNPSVIGLDTNSFSNSYTDESGTWELFTDGNFMIRAIVDPNPGSGAGEEITPIPEISISNYPNPFNPETTINLYLPFAGQAELKIYNVKGELVNTLLDGYLEAGSTTIIWDGSDSNGKLVSSGLYMYTLETKKQTVSKKMILLK